MQNFQAWLKQPFSSSMSVAGWFWFFGLILAITVIWKLILIPIEEV
jgi:hypothetical protein